MNYLVMALHLLNFITPQMQQSFVQIYHAAGALTEQSAVVTSQEAQGYIDNANHVSARAALDFLNERGQRARELLRPKDVERQQMGLLSSEQFELLKPKLEQLGFVEPITPKQRTFDAVLILGATETGCRQRMKLFAQLAPELTFKHIYLVTGKRDLWPNDSGNKTKGENITLHLVLRCINEKYSLHSHTSKSTCSHNLTKEQLQAEFDAVFSEIDYTDGVQVNAARKQIIADVTARYGITWPTETDMMLELSNQALGQYRDRISVVDTPKGKEGARPTTLTSLEYLNQQHSLNSALVISAQPVAKYQCAIAQTTLPATKVDLAANGTICMPTNITQVLEALYAFVYAQKMYLEASGLIESAAIQAAKASSPDDKLLVFKPTLTLERRAA